LCQGRGCHWVSYRTRGKYHMGNGCLKFSRHLRIITDKMIGSSPDYRVMVLGLLASMTALLLLFLFCTFFEFECSTSTVIKLEQQAWWWIDYSRLFACVFFLLRWWMGRSISDVSDGKNTFIPAAAHALMVFSFIPMIAILLTQKNVEIKMTDGSCYAYLSGVWQSVSPGLFKGYAFGNIRRCIAFVILHLWILSVLFANPFSNRVNSGR